MRGVAAKFALFGLSMILAGCAGREPTGRPVSALPPAGTASVGSARALSSAAYVATASAIELYEIQSAELALQQSRTQHVRDFATTALEAHRGASMQLSLAGRRLNLLPSATLSPPYQAMMAELRSAPDFDALYRRQQAAVHRDALRLHRNYAALGSSPTLRPVASALVPIFERDLRFLSR